MNRRRLLLALSAVLAAAVASPARAQLAGKKILFVNSYHEGYEWSDGVEKGAKIALAPTGAQLKFFRMDTKRHQDEAFRKAAGEKAKAEIEALKPDLVIVSDDPATKYVLQAYFKDSKIPFVFCGVNWDAAKYGLPYKNATGMVEVAPVKELVGNLKSHAKGTRVAYLTVDSETERIEAPAYAAVLGSPFTATVFAKTMAEWKQAFIDLQGKADVILLGNNTISDWNDAEARAVVAANAKVPVGAAYDYLMPYAMLGLIKIGEEQGAFAGQAAVRILKGEAPMSIPVAQNKQSKILLNAKLAAGAGVIFRPEIARVAQVVK